MWGFDVYCSYEKKNELILKFDKSYGKAYILSDN